MSLSISGGGGGGGGGASAVGAAGQLQASDGDGGLTSTGFLAELGVLWVPRYTGVGIIEVVKSDGAFVYLGDQSRNDFGLLFYSGGDMQLRTASAVSLGLTPYATFSSSKAEMGAPVMGLAAPFSAHAGASLALSSGASEAVPAAAYVCEWIDLETGDCVADHEVVFPHPASKAYGYGKRLVNQTAYVVTVSTGTGTTRTIAAGLGQRVWIDDSGVRYDGPTFTP